MQDDNRPAAGFRLTVAITPGDIGKRVSVRRRVGDARFTDVVGVLEDWAQNRIVIRRRDGQLVEFDADTMVAGKVVPQAWPRRRSG